jgi:phosphoglycerate dehydrogenase-like enzyme
MFKKNELAILAALRMAGEATFTELLATTELARSSAHVALRSLVGNGLVLEFAERRRSTFQLAPADDLKQAEDRLVTQFRNAVFESGDATRRPRLVFTDRYVLSEAGMRQLRVRYDVRSYEQSPPFMTDELFRRRAQNAEVVVRFDTPTVDDEVLAGLPDLRVIACPDCTVHNIDLEACERRGVRVVSFDPVKQRYFQTTQIEFVVNALLTLRKPLIGAAQAVQYEQGFRPPARLDSDLRGSRVGLVFGDADVSKLVSVLHALDCQVSASNVGTEARSAMSFGLTGYTSLDHVWAWSDFVVFFGGSRIDINDLLRASKVPEYLVILNDGVLYEPEILREQILAGRVKGAVLDVLPGMFTNRAFDFHPQVTLRPIVNLPNVYLTPELGVLSTTSMARSEEYLLPLLLNMGGFT